MTPQPFARPMHRRCPTRPTWILLVLPLRAGRVPGVVPQRRRLPPAEHRGAGGGERPHGHAAQAARPELPAEPLPAVRLRTPLVRQLPDPRLALARRKVPQVPAADQPAVPADRAADGVAVHVVLRRVLPGRAAVGAADAGGADAAGGAGRVRRSAGAVQRGAGRRRAGRRAAAGLCAVGGATGAGAAGRHDRPHAGTARRRRRRRLPTVVGDAQARRRRQPAGGDVAADGENLPRLAGLGNRPDAGVVPAGGVADRRAAVPHPRRPQLPAGRRRADFARDLRPAAGAAVA